MMLQKVLRDNNADMIEFCKDLEKWEVAMEKKESKTQSSEDLKDAKKPKVRKLSGSKKAKDEKPKKIPSIDYSSWEKFDAEAECAKLDEDSEESALTDECDEATIELANAEKDKGNKFVKEKEWQKAIEKYSQAIKLFTYDPVYYANRALCYLKLEKYELCQTDCNKALRLDPNYVKAYHRRSSALEALGHLSAAHEDLKSILKLEPNNKDVKNELKKLEKKLEESSKNSKNESQRPKSKFTMSRQNSDKVNPNTSQNVAKNIIEPIKSHVIERKPIQNDIIGGIIEKSDMQNNSSKNTSVFNSRRAEQSNNNVTNSNLRDTSILWPSGDNVELVQAIMKSPKQRSTKKLQRISVQDVYNTKSDVSVENIAKKNISKPLIEEISSVENKPRVSDVVKVQNLENSAVINKFVQDDISHIDFTKPAKTAVQFVRIWNALSTFEDKLDYLRIINPNTMGEIFKESLSSKLFSDILATLAKDDKKAVSVYQYLLGLTKVKRFSTLTMFMSQNDKKNLLILIDFMRLDVSLDQSDVDNLIKTYEL